MKALIRQASSFRGRLSVPPDKSIGQRAVLIAALAEGETELRPWPSGDDCRQALALIQHLGVRVSRSGDAVRITGRGREGLTAPTGELFCGESGTAFRLAAGVLAGQSFTSRLTAAPSLSRRPMRRVVEPLSQMGATFDAATPASGSSEWFPPLTIHGRRPLRPIRYELPVASAQVKSAVLFAGLAAEGPTVVVERRPTRDHTERMLRHFGVRVRRDGSDVILEPGPLRTPGPTTLPGDWSSAAFFLAAALCLPDAEVTIEGVGLNPTRTGLLEVLRRMGGKLQAVVEGDLWEPRGLVTARAGTLRGLILEPDEAPALIDELPILMVAATQAEGKTSLRGVGELRVKETDRIQSMVEGLQRLGGRIRVAAPDTIEIEPSRLRGAEVDSRGDHRTAMSLAVAGLLAEGETVIRGAECVAKSFPEFFDALRSLAGSPTVKTVDKA
jgi:3-phosphoshikimate 1-carboxyvinyltransferase